MYANSKGVKYLHGVEIYLTSTLNEKIRDNYHTILIAKNKDGIKELNTLVDLSTREDHVYYKPRISFDEFLNISDNVIKISACLASPLNKYPSSVNAIYEKIKKLEDERDYEISLLTDNKYNEFFEAEKKRYEKMLAGGSSGFGGYIELS